MELIGCGTWSCDVELVEELFAGASQPRCGPNACGPVFGREELDRVGIDPFELAFDRLRGTVLPGMLFAGEMGGFPTCSAQDAPRGPAQET